jgi:hypothetical protein
MDLQELWTNIPEGEDIEQADFRKKANDSRHPLVQLRRSLRLHLVYVYVITLGYFLVIYFEPDVYIRCIMALLILFDTFYIWRTHQILASHKKKTLFSSPSLLAELKDQHGSMTQFLRQGEKMGLLFYPISASAGMMYGAMQGSGKSLPILWAEPWFWPTLLVVALILTPISHYSAKWMNKIAFGTHLDRIASLINELEQIDLNNSNNGKIV